jgi:hypothetical protein
MRAEQLQHLAEQSQRYGVSDCPEPVDLDALSGSDGTETEQSQVTPNNNQPKEIP